MNDGISYSKTPGFTFPAHLIHVDQPPRQTRVSLSPDQRNRSPAIYFGFPISATWSPSSFLEIRHACSELGWSRRESWWRANQGQQLPPSCRKVDRLPYWLLLSGRDLGQNLGSNRLKPHMGYLPCLIDDGSTVFGHVSLTWLFLFKLFDSRSMASRFVYIAWKTLHGIF